MQNTPVISPCQLIVCARRSPLSQVQLHEVQKALSLHHEGITFQSLLVDTKGDKDRTTSLRTLDKTDFFTQELDHLLLAGKCRLAIHSAKDLPDPIMTGLKVIALMKGVDSSDSLVMREGMSFETLPEGASIATSSKRREENVRQMRPDLTFIDIRGTIEERLDKLESGDADGIVIAEAALIRLEMTHLNRITLPGTTSRYQGQLAVMAQSTDQEMFTLFASLDCREDRESL